MHSNASGSHQVTTTIQTTSHHIAALQRISFKEQQDQDNPLNSGVVPTIPTHTSMKIDSIDGLIVPTTTIQYAKKTTNERSIIRQITPGPKMSQQHLQQTKDKPQETQLTTDPP